MHSLRSKKKLVAEKRPETHILSNEEKEKSIEDYVEKETTGARKRVEDAKVAIRQEQEATEEAQNAGVTAREPKKTFPEMMVAIWDSLSDIASSYNGEDGEDGNDKETEQGQRSEDNEPDWVMSMITKPVQQRMERFRLKLMKLD